MRKNQLQHFFISSLCEGSRTWSRPLRREQRADGQGGQVQHGVNPLSIDSPPLHLLHHHQSIPAAPLTAGITIQQLRWRTLKSLPLSRRQRLHVSHCLPPPCDTPTQKKSILHTLVTAVVMQTNTASDAHKGSAALQWRWEFKYSVFISVCF